ncbi:MULTISPECIES: potassium channel protein [unclassified Nitratiruptor]|uniref:potassium channel protein n=1 Tax=unclassified Nitratiruptor TaxID=2624044 RepID=UPI001915FE28|nr:MULTISPECIES: potassium channel protein [unclassified Nitratiruptor]BCD60422.1 voltage-gated potassium channel [Nitratiruptor sp. YY08-10]BCD64089.1 voltage-gated potassium channel [Nitratiruptor sp. YY08-14]
MSFSKFLIDLAFLLDNSPRYKKIKLFFWNLLNNDDYKYKKYFDIFMIFLIISSVIILIEEVTTPISKILYYYDVYVVTGVFLVEYILRFWVYNDIHKIILDEYEESLFLDKKFDTKKVIKQIVKSKLEYIFSPLAIIDLLAILPSYRELRILRVFILFRVFKLLRYSHNLTHFFQVIATKKIELYTLFMLMAFVILVSGISLYVFEDRINPNINSLFDAFYWALVTISTVGFGDITPVTHEGRSITMIIILIGVGMISFATSIIVSAFSEQLEQVRNNRVRHTIRKLTDFYIICGYTNMAQLFIKRLEAEKQPFIVIDQDKKIVESLLLEGKLAVAEDATKKSAFKNIDFDKVKAVLLLTNSDMHNIYIALNVRSFSKKVYLLSRTIDNNSYKKLKLAGVDEVISPYLTSGYFASLILEQPIALQAINDILTARKNALCDQIEVTEGSFLENKPIRDIEVNRFKILILGVVRFHPEKKIKYLQSEFIFNPQEDFVLRANDVLVIMGYSISISSFKSYIIESSLKHV